jgi:hypothetical protein
MNKVIVLTIALTLGFLTACEAGEVKLTTYYPSPYGEYYTLRTTSKTSLSTKDNDENSYVLIGATGSMRSNGKLQVYTSRSPDDILLSGLTINRWLRLGVNLGGGSWNSMTAANDVGIFFGTDTRSDAECGLTIGPWVSLADTSQLRGMRIRGNGTVSIGTYYWGDNRPLVVGGETGTGKFPGLTVVDGNPPSRIYSFYIAANKELCIGDDISAKPRIRINQGAGTGGIFINGGSGNVGIGNLDGTAGGDINSPTSSLDVDSGSGLGYKQFRLRTPYRPSGSGDSNGNTGDIAWGQDGVNYYIYVKTPSGWRRALLTPF